VKGARALEGHGSVLLMMERTEAQSGTATLSAIMDWHLAASADGRTLVPNAEKRQVGARTRHPPNFDHSAILESGTETI